VTVNRSSSQRGKSAPAASPRPNPLAGGEPPVDVGNGHAAERAAAIDAGELAAKVEQLLRRVASASPGRSIEAGEVMSLAELKRRLKWREHAVRQARKAGLRLIRFGSQKYALGSDVLDFFRQLAEQQTQQDHLENEQSARQRGENGKQ